MDEHHITVEKGPDAGLKIKVPPEGVRLGRSSRNDIKLTDPLLSRHHCRLFFKTNEGLWITDLGSANGTLVNGAQIQEIRLGTGDTIELGDSRLKVLCTGDSTGSSGALPASNEGREQITAPAGSAESVDLGLDRKPPQTARSNLLGNRKLLYAVLTAVTLLAVLAWSSRLAKKKNPADVIPADSIAPAVPPSYLDLEYEKILADRTSIFRYHLRIKNNSMLVVEIDDLSDDRHVRKEKELDPDILREFAESLKSSGFFQLERLYGGIKPDTLEQWDLSITIGGDIHHSRAANRIPPEEFTAVTDMIENFGKNELGLWAIQFSAEKLTAMALDALEDGKKLYDNRDVAFGNLAAAIKKFTEAEWYLETVEPKPEFFPEAISLSRECRTELNARYEDANFRAARAVKMRQWEEAAAELRTIRELIPDRSDSRNKDAAKDLLDLERRIKTR